VTPSIDLVFFEGCPHIDQARANIRAALGADGLQSDWREHNQSDSSTDAEWRGFPSPTVLVNGVDVLGDSRAAGSCCRATGAPGVDAIAAALKRT
jgi:hypothetical protein